MCTLCDSNCADCAGEPNMCTACYDGFYISADSTCAPCDSNCHTCSDASTCTSCFSDSYHNGAGECVCNEGYRDMASGFCFPQCATGRYSIDGIWCDGTEDLYFDF